MVAHTFIPSTREVDIGSDMAGQREKYQEGGERGLGIMSEDLYKQDTQFDLRIS